MAGEGTIFLIFLVIVIAVCIRWGIRSIFRNKKPTANTVPGLTRTTARRPSEGLCGFCSLQKIMLQVKYQKLEDPIGKCVIRSLFTAKRNNVSSAAPRSTRSAERRPSEVRRTTVYTITADPRGNDPANDFTDFFWDGLPHASSSQNEPAKDDKDLPTYEEVMQLEMTRQAVGSTTVTPANNNTTTSSVVAPVIPVVTASTI